MANAALSRERANDSEVFPVEAQRDLLRARRANLHVQIFEILCELLHAMTRPEVAFFPVASEARNPALLGSRAH